MRLKVAADIHDRDAMLGLSLPLSLRRHLAALLSSAQIARDETAQAGYTAEAPTASLSARLR